MESITAIITVVLALAMVMVLFSWISASMDRAPGAPNLLELSPSYIVYQDGWGYTLAKDCKISEVAYSDRNSAHVIQYCIDHLPANVSGGAGGLIWIKVGTYEIDTGIIINRSDVKLMGEASQRSTILLKTANIDMFTLHGTGRIAFVEFANLAFFGNDRAYTGRMIVADTFSQGPVITNCQFNGNDGTAISLYDVWGQGPTIRDCKIYDCGNATDALVEILGGSNAIIIDNVGIAPMDYVGIHIDTISNNVVITNCQGEANSDSPSPQIWIEGFSVTVTDSHFNSVGEDVAIIEDEGDRNTISNNIISGAYYLCYGIYFHGTRSVIDGNYIYNAKNGIRIENGWATVSNNFMDACVNGIYSSGAILATGNHIQYSKGDGFWMDGSGSGIIDANLIENSGDGTTPAVFSGLLLDGSCENLITNNRITDWRVTKTQQYGVKEIAPAQSNWIYDNYLAGNDEDGVLKVGSTTKLHNNIGFTTEYHGIYVCNGNGSATYYIPHGLVATPTYFSVLPYYPDANASEGMYVWADDTYLIVCYFVAPDGGTNNIRLTWYAEVYH